jgi:catechol 2,3-dioxygenase-like lactoylglutathione lyase family enzyme
MHVELAMSVLGIDEIRYGAQDLPRCRQFFLDWGLQLDTESPSELRFSTLNGCAVAVSDLASADLPAGIEEGPSLREVVWGVRDHAALDALASKLNALPSYVRDASGIRCQDPMGLSLRIQITRKRSVELPCASYNTWSEKSRVNQAAPAYERATPIEIGHVVLFVRDVSALEKFYTDYFGFVTSDRYPGRGAFMRCGPRGGHHNLFLLQRPGGAPGLNHVAFKVRDIHEVFGGGLHMSRCGWDTQLGPGRHPISSAYFWYFKNPAGALAEYYTDEDELTEAWQPRDFEPGPTVFAEWAVDGGLDGHTRRQKGVVNDGQFLTDKK